MLLLWSLLLLLLLGAPAAPSPEPVPEWQGECTPGGGTRSARRGWGRQGSGERANLGDERGQPGRPSYLVAAYLQSEQALHPFLGVPHPLSRAASSRLQPGRKEGRGLGLQAILLNAGRGSRQGRLGGGSERQLPRIVYSAGASLG